MVEPDWKPKADQLLKPIRLVSDQDRFQQVGETGLDILDGHFSHVLRQDARRLLTAIACARIEGFKTRFAGGNELSIQPSRMFGELGYDPTSDVAMGPLSPNDSGYLNSAYITVYEIERAIAQGRLKLINDPTARTDHQNAEATRLTITEERAIA